MSESTRVVMLVTSRGQAGAEALLRMIFERARPELPEDYQNPPSLDSLDALPRHRLASLAVQVAADHPAEGGGA